MADARWLRRRIERVRVHSNADGSMGIEVRWREPYAVKSHIAGMERDLPPGLFTRMDAAEEIESALNKLLGATR